MTEGEILDLFIRAAAVDHRLPHAPKPAKLKGQSLPFQNSAEERTGWEPADFSDGIVLTRKDRLGNDIQLTEAQRRLLKKQSNDRLEYGDTGRLAIQAEAFWNGERISPAQISELEYALELMRSVRSSRNRRCLWAYAKSKAKVLFAHEEEITHIIVPDDGVKKRKPYAVTESTRKRMSFSKWCVEVEDIHRNYGATCAAHAISEIACKVFGKALFTNDNVRNSTLQNCPDLGHLLATLDNDAQKATDRMTVEGWCVADTDKALRRFDKELVHVQLTDLRNARRRQREAERRKRQAA